jgi:hypothetical protein
MLDNQMRGFFTMTNLLWFPAAILPLLSACAVHFSNAQSRISPEYRLLYVPAAADASPTGGNSLRISEAVRRALMKNGQFRLVGAQDARWGIDIQLRERRIAIQTVEACSPSERTFGAGAYACDESNIQLPTKVAATEGIALTAEVSAIDMRTGQSVRRTVVQIKDSEVPYWVVADKEGDGARVRQSLSRTPELHALRYAENIDNSISRVGDRIASQIMGMLQALAAGQ